MKLKIKLIDSTIEQQVQKIDYIANARVVLADPIVSTELARLRNNKKDKKTEAKTEAKIEETKIEEADTETKAEEVPAVENEQKIARDTNIAKQNVEQNVEENIVENAEPEIVAEINEINQGESNEEFNRENESRGRVS